MLKAYIICMFSVKKRKYHLIDHTTLSALIVEIQFNWKAFGFYMQQIADPEGQFIWNVFKEMRVRGEMERGFWHWIYLPDKNGIHHVLLLLLWLSVVFTAHIARERTTQTISQMLFRMIRFDDQLFSQCRIFFTSPQKNTNTFAWTYVHTCMYTLHTDTKDSLKCNVPLIQHYRSIRSVTLIKMRVSHLHAKINVEHMFC